MGDRMNRRDFLTISSASALTSFYSQVCGRSQYWEQRAERRTRFRVRRPYETAQRCLLYAR
jgi:hypothetical protein